MRICFVSWEFPIKTGFGGIAYYVSSICDHLYAIGFDITVITANPECDKIERRNFKGYNLILVGASSQRLFSQRLEKVLGEEVTVRGKFDIMESAEYLGDTKYVSDVHEFCHIKITRLHGSLIQYYFYKNPKLLFWLYPFWNLIPIRIFSRINFYLNSSKIRIIINDRFERNEARQADYVTAPSQILVKFAVDYWNIKSVLITPNPPTFEVIPIIKNKNYVKQTVELSYIGTISFIKGFDLFLDFLNALLKKNDNRKYCIHIAGRYNESNKQIVEWQKKIGILKLAKNFKVIEYGFIKHNKVKNILCKTDFLFVLSKFDNFPNVHVEGMVQGCLVFSGPGSGTNFLSELTDVRLSIKQYSKLNLIENFISLINMDAQSLYELKLKSQSIVKEELLKKDYSSFYRSLIKDVRSPTTYSSV